MNNIEHDIDQQWHTAHLIDRFMLTCERLRIGNHQDHYKDWSAIYNWVIDNWDELKEKYDL